MGTVLQDLRNALRMFRRRPAFAVVASGTLALGIGAHAALFSVVDDVLLRPLDLPRSEDLVITRMNVNGELRNLTGPNLIDLLRETGDVFSSAAGFWDAGVTMERPDGTREQHDAVGATAGIFDALGVSFTLGGSWGREAEGAGSITAIVITDEFWRSQFGADPGVVGKTVLLEGNAVEITGVLASGFEFPLRESADVIFPPVNDISRIQRAGLGGFTMLARLRAGVSVERARGEVERAWDGLRARYPGDLLENGIAVVRLQDHVVRDVKPALLVLLGASALLLVLACANVANLMLAQGIGRSTEMSIRASLGARRQRLARQLIVESAVLAAAAGLAGIVFASASLSLIRSFAPPEIPGIAEARLSARAFGFALATAVACALLVGVVPAARASGTCIAGVLRSGTRASAGRKVRRLQRSLVIAQVAAAVVLVVGAGLLIRSFSRLASVDPGYRTDGVLTAEIIAPREFYRDRASAGAFFQRVEQEVALLPGVRRVGTTYRPPFSTLELSVPVRMADMEGLTLENAPRVEIGIVSEGYIDALGISLLRGRNFTDQDRAESPRVVLMSESLARSLYGSDDPVGRRLAPVLGSWEGATDWAEVVGVVGDIRLQGLDAPTARTLYLASRQLPQPYGVLMVHTDGDASQLVGPVRETVLRVEPKIVDPTIQTLAARRADSLARPRFNSLLSAFFTAVALTLAIAGIYGLLSYSIAARRLEMGVRMALGANRGSVLRLVLWEGMKLAGCGLLIGLVGARFASRALSALLFGIEPLDPATYVGTVMAVFAIAFAGSLVPALRASGGEAQQALRSQ